MADEPKSDDKPTAPPPTVDFDDDLDIVESSSFAPPPVAKPPAPPRVPKAPPLPRAARLGSQPEMPAARPVQAPEPPATPVPAPDTSDIDVSVDVESSASSLAAALGEAPAEVGSATQEVAAAADPELDPEPRAEPPAPADVLPRPPATPNLDGVPRDVELTDKTERVPAVIPGASKLPPAPIEAVEAIEGAVERLRAEARATDDGARRARLHGEIGELLERAGEESGAARDYLAAYNADPTFREPLEGLVRLLERRRSLSNLGKLVEALVTSASTPAERARALAGRAAFLEDVQGDLEGARGAAREAIEAGAGAPDTGAAWLTLEVVSAKLGDAAAREEALSGRAALVSDPTWKALLLVDAAALAAQAGEIERALATLDQARGAGGRATFRAALAAARLLRAEPGLPGSDEARDRAQRYAEVLEAQAELVRVALSDADAGDATGVPLRARTRDHMVDLWLRAAEARKTAGNLAAAGAVLDRALEVLGGEGDASEGSVAEHVALAARIRIAELTGDTALAATLAKRRMMGESDGGTAAALAMRVAEHGASEGDVAAALDALRQATDRDPTCAPARALEIDILADAPDAAAFAGELEDLSRHLTSGDAQGRALMLAAFVWATRGRDGDRAKEALVQAEACGVSRELVTRLARSLAALHGDDGWYEDATRRLIEEKPGGEDSSELALLWIEVARLRTKHGDEAGAAAAIGALRELPSGAWLSRILDALAPPQGEAERSRAALESLIVDVEDPELARALRVMAVLRALRAGDTRGATEHASKLAEDDGADALVASMLGDAHRLSGDRASASVAAASAGAALSDVDPMAAAARHIEAGLELWKLGERGDAIAAFVAAEALAPDAAGSLARWAARGAKPDDLGARRDALRVAANDPSTALEAFVLDALAGDVEAADAALGALEISSNADLRRAGALSRLAWAAGGEAPDAIAGALDELAAAGPASREMAGAERTRVARETAPETAADAARAWLDDGGGTVAALEWLAAAMGARDLRAEVPARRALAEVVADEAKEAMHASASLLEALLGGDEAVALVSGSSHAARLANLELAPPGCDPRRRASALSEVNGALGDDAEVDALGLAAWSALAAGDAEAALDVFRTATAARADDLHAWEGMRAAAEVLKDFEAYAVACEQLGARCLSAGRGAAFWESAALAWLKLGGPFEQRAEAALDASFERDPSREVAFDKLFRRVRDRKDGDKLLEIVARRLSVADDPSEIAKLYWEQARVLREKRDADGALEALEHVTMFDEDHVGALALTGEIFIRQGRFEEAAEKLARLARVPAAPPKNRVTAGVAAVDLYENKLGRHDLALEVLLHLHEARLTTLPVRERLAKAAARTGSWADATRILEELMHERPEAEGRIEAARLAMVIHRDRLASMPGAVRAAAKLLAEAPRDAEALELLISTESGTPERGPLLERGRDALLLALHEAPGDVAAHGLLARVSHALGDGALEQAALSCRVALGGPDGSSEQMIALLSSRKPRVPQVALTEAMLRQLLAPGDDGPVADLFVLLGPTLAEALGPSTAALGVTKKDRVDAKAGLALRNEIASWAGAFGITDFDLYVGGKDPTGVTGVPGDTPAIVLGSAVNAPLAPAVRGRVARELLGIVRGTAITRWRDDTTIAAIVVAACNITKVRVDSPPFAVLAEVERHISKAIGRKTRAAAEPICRAIVASGADAKQWVNRARASHGRASLVAAGDVAVVMSDVFGLPVEQLGHQLREDMRAHDLLRFVLSRPYFDLRRALGLEGA